MKQLFNFKRIIIKWILVGLLSGLILFEFIYRLGVINGALISTVFGQIFIILLLLSTLGIAIYAIILNKFELIKFFGITLFGYFIINKFLSYPTTLNMLENYNPAMRIVSGVFILLTLLAYSSFAVMYLIVKLTNKYHKLNEINILVLICALCSSFFALIFTCIFYGQNGWAWYWYFKAIIDYIIIPLLLIITCLYLFPKTSALKKDDLQDNMEE